MSALAGIAPLALAGVLAASPGTGGTAPSPRQDLLALLKRLSSEGWVEGAEFAYHRTHGLPPAPFEELRLSGRSETTQIVYTRTAGPEGDRAQREECRFERGGKPIPLLPELVAQRLFSRRYPQEKARAGTGPRFHFRISDGRSSLEKTFHGALPRSLAGAQEQIQALVRQCAREGRRPAPADRPAQAPIGTATMQADGTLILDLVAEGPAGERGEARFVYPPDHKEYADILKHLGGLRPGESKPVPPWPE